MNQVRYLPIDAIQRLRGLSFLKHITLVQTGRKHVPEDLIQGKRGPWILIDFSKEGQKLAKQQPSTYEDNSGRIFRLRRHGKGDIVLHYVRSIYAM